MKSKSPRKKRRRHGQAKKHVPITQEDRAAILVRLLREPVRITEEGIERKIAVIEAIILQLWIATLAGKTQAASILSKYCMLIPQAQDGHIQIEFDKDFHVPQVASASVIHEK